VVPDEKIDLMRVSKNPLLFLRAMIPLSLCSKRSLIIDSHIDRCRFEKFEKFPHPRKASSV
jgi:hypothetical protein